MERMGFVSSAADDCLYVKRKRDRAEVLVLVYVDDMAVVAPNIRDVLLFKAELGKVFQITDLGELKHILGIRVRHDCTARRIRLDQMAYIQALLSRFNMQDSMPVATPATIKGRLSTSDCPTTDDDCASYNTFAQNYGYLECLGGILYATHTRPDIQYATNICAQFGSNPVSCT